jgi:hypothetical protein
MFELLRGFSSLPVEQLAPAEIALPGPFFCCKRLADVYCGFIAKEKTAMNITRQERLEAAHENNPYFIEAGNVARFSWADMNADLVAVATAREHIKKAIEAVEGMSQSIDSADLDYVASCIGDGLSEANDKLFNMVEHWSKEASEETFADA